MSRIIKEMTEAAEGLNKIGLMTDKELEKIKNLSIPKLHHLSPAQIKHLREKYKVTQVTFAKLIHVSPSLVKKWETGDREPKGIFLMNLNMIEKKGIQPFLSM
jgi:putative transcriptional regulator